MQEWKLEKYQAMSHRAEALKQAFDMPELNDQLLSIGAYFAYVKHPFDADSHKVAKRLVEEYEVLCLPGVFFGEGQEQYLRFAFANVDEVRFPELVQRLIESQSYRPLKDQRPLLDVT